MQQLPSKPSTSLRFTFYRGALETWKDLSLPNTQKLIYWVLYCYCAFFSRLRDGMKCVCVCVCTCASLHVYPEEKNKLFVCVLACTLSSNTMRWTLMFLLIQQVTCSCKLVSVWLDKREWETVCLHSVCVFVCVSVWLCCCYEEKAILLHTWDKHNGGNKSGQCCLVLS